MARPPKLDNSRLWFSRLVDLIICHGVFALRGGRRGGQDENKIIAETKRIFIPRLTLRNHRVARKTSAASRSRFRCAPFPFRQELFIPPTITIEEMTGFSLFALKAVLSGRRRGRRPLYHGTLGRTRSIRTSTCPEQPRQLEREMGSDAME